MHLHCLHFSVLRSGRWGVFFQNKKQYVEECYASQDGLVCVVLTFNCSAIVFCIGKHHKGPISFTRSLPAHFRILATQTREEITLGLLITDLDPPSPRRIEFPIIPVVSNALRALLLQLLVDMFLTTSRPKAACTSHTRVHTCRLYHLGPLCKVGFNKIQELFRRVSHGFGALSRKPRANIRSAKHVYDFGI